MPVIAAFLITGLSALLTVLGNLELIASFSSMTFLLVSIAVCVANLKLRSITRSAVVPVAGGIVLMSVTVVLLVLYLSRNDTAALYFAGGVYGTVAAAFFLFQRFGNQRHGVSGRK